MISRKTRIWLAIILILLLAACSVVPGSIRYRSPQTGEEWTVVNDPQAEAPASLTKESDGAVRAQVSPPQEEDVAVKQLGLIPLIGTGLIVVGVGTLTLRGWFPSVPIGASIAAILTGGALVALPKIVQEAWWVLALLIAAPALLYVISWIDNRRKLKGAKT